MVVDGHSDVLLCRKLVLVCIVIKVVTAIHATIIIVVVCSCR